ncbi:hypothetical protein ABZ468_49875 [Streptomyces sp. NPDC005708]|uniref:hypothetical protein n=1 Tax=Streptomyces sp. NPDC005708 TaxID=3154564 RepID=UPI0033EB9C3D
MANEDFTRVEDMNDDEINEIAEEIISMEMDEFIIFGTVTNVQGKLARNGSRYLKIDVVKDGNVTEPGDDEVITEVYHWPNCGRFLLWGEGRRSMLVEMIVEYRGDWLHLVNVRWSGGDWAAPLF